MAFRQSIFINDNKNDIGLNHKFNQINPQFVVSNQKSVNTYLGTFKDNLPQIQL